MNDKQLIERLRHCVGCDDCAGCQDYGKENCIEDLLSTAADRISDLLTEMRLLREKTRRIQTDLKIPGKRGNKNAY